MAGRMYVFAGVAGFVGRPHDEGDVGVFRRPADAGEWQHVLQDVETHMVVVHPGDPDVVLAGTVNGVWRSGDHGATFARSAFPDEGVQIWSFLVDSRDPDRILAGASPISFYESRDRGLSWTRLPDAGIAERTTGGPFSARVMRMVQHPQRPDEIFAALEVNGVIRSEDFGRSWIDCSDHLVELSRLPQYASKIVTNEESEGMLDGHAITISEADPEDVVLACRMGLFRSADKGRTWQDMEMNRFSPITYGRDIKVAASDPNTLYAALSVAAASHDGAIYQSRDAGKSWTRFDKVQVHGTIMSVGLSAQDPKSVYIGARYNGEVFGTRDGGESWQELPLPGQVKDIYCVTCG